MTRITRVDPLPTVIIRCSPDELDARLTALLAGLYTLATTGAVVAGEARQTPVVVGEEAPGLPGEAAE